jgi:hypothetical protein
MAGVLAAAVYGFGLVLPVLRASAVVLPPPAVNIRSDAGVFKLNVTAQPGSWYCVESSSDAVLWQPLAVANPSSGQFELSDPEAVFCSQRFYRVRAGTPGSISNGAQGFVVSVPVLNLYQGQTGSFTTQLASQPADAVTVNAARTGGDTNIVVSGGTQMLFTPLNWNRPQTVTVAAGTNSDWVDSLATLTLTSSKVPGKAVYARAINQAVDEEFVGPFPSWANAKINFGAKGDGVTDDTVALQNALTSLRSYANKGALFLPAGVYRITQTLNVLRVANSESKDIIIVGEDPATTTLRWDGATNGLMMEYQAWYAKMGRLTFDGRGKAKTAIAHGAIFSTHNEFSDMVFTNLAFGIEAGTTNGQGNAECAVERCRFANCSRAGISIQNWNSLDWFIWDCEFDDCLLGVSNIYGSGNYHVYQSLFRNSGQADMSIGNTGYFSIRDNTSIGSKAFFTAAGNGSCGLITLQGNTVINPRGTPVQVNNRGPVLLLDNRIQDYQGSAVSAVSWAGFVSVGNTFTSTNAVRANPGGIFLDDVVTLEKLPVTLPKMPGTLPNLKRTVIDLAGPTNSAGLQAAINKAATFSGQRPVVHLPPGIYGINQTVTIPAGCDLQLVGDGARTELRWAGSNSGPVLRLAGPARATLRDFIIFGTFNSFLADGIEIDNCDQPGARIHLDQVDVRQAASVGFLAEGLVNANIDLDNFYHSINPVSVQVKGAGQPFSSTAGRVAIFGGASSGNGLSYDVTEGGNLLVRDTWYEASGTNQPSFMRCTNSGYFTLHGANVAPAWSQTNLPTVAFSNFVGTATFLATQFSFPNTSLAVNGPGQDTAVLLLGTVNSNDPIFNSPQAQASLQQSFKYSTNNNGTFTALGSTGPADPDFLRKMLRQTRTAKPTPLVPLPAGVTDARLSRVFVQGGRVTIHLKN